MSYDNRYRALLDTIQEYVAKAALSAVKAPTYIIPCTPEILDYIRNAKPNFSFHVPGPSFNPNKIKKNVSIQNL